MALKKTVLIAAAAALSLTACGEEDAPPAENIPLVAVSFEVALNPAPGRPAAGYGFITGPAQTALTSVSSPEAGRIELHIMERQGESMRMKKVDALMIDSDGGLRFERGGRHLMIFDIADGADEDGEMQLDFTFDDGSSLTANAAIKK